MLYWMYINIYRWAMNQSFSWQFFLRVFCLSFLPVSFTFATRYMLESCTEVSQESYSLTIQEKKFLWRLVENPLFLLPDISVIFLSLVWAGFMGKNQLATSGRRSHQYLSWVEFHFRFRWEAKKQWIRPNNRKKSSCFPAFLLWCKAFSFSWTPLYWSGNWISSC